MSKEVITPKFRVSFPHVFEPYTDKSTGKSNYMVTMLFDKKADLSKLGECIKEAKQEGIKNKWGGKLPKNLQSPFRNGDEKEYDGYEDMVFCIAKSQGMPGVIDYLKKIILSPEEKKRHQKNPEFLDTEDASIKDISEEEFYAGCYARASLTAYPWTYMGKNGVSFGLQNLQKMDDGEPFSGKTKAEDDFEALPQRINEKEDINPAEELFNYDIG